MIPSRCLRRFAAGGLATAVLGLPALAHTDDPKADSVLPAYQGPGWYESEGGIAGSVFPASTSD